MPKDGCQEFCAARNILFANISDTSGLKHVLHLNGWAQADYREEGKRRSVRVAAACGGRSRVPGYAYG